jgi:hypothetical protein
MTDITMLSFMADSDIIASLNKQSSWDVRVLDFKNNIFGKSVIDLTDTEAGQLRDEMHNRGMSLYCLSSDLFYDDIEKGEAYFEVNHLGKLTQALHIANILKPKVFRLLAATSGKRAKFTDSVHYMQVYHPWVIPMYRQAVDQIRTQGFEVTIENEIGPCIWTNPDEILQFFNLLDRRDHVYFTYDVQNLWVMGTFPTIEIYRKLAPIIGFFHLKGGQSGADGKLEWSSTLEDASWPVAEMVKQVVLDGVSPVICLNPSHGKLRKGYNYMDTVRRDLDYIRKIIHEMNNSRETPTCQN